MARKGTCPSCERRVRTTSTSGALIAAVHQSPDGALCPGTGLLVVAPTGAKAKRTKPARRTTKKPLKTTKRKQPEKKMARTKRGVSEQELKAIRSSEALERAERESAQQWDVGGRRSVRTVSGGAPTLGKRR